MPATSSLFSFALVCLGLVLTPGPNMMYLVSRSICQGRKAGLISLGRKAGLISLGGVGLGFLVYMLAAALGITALLFAVPLAYDALRSGRLVMPFDLALPSGRAYYFVCAKRAADRSNVRAFRAWVREEAAALDWKATPLPPLWGRTDLSA